MSLCGVTAVTILTVIYELPSTNCFFAVCLHLLFVAGMLSFHVVQQTVSSQWFQAVIDVAFDP